MDDLISRQAAIDALKRDERYNEDIPNRADGVRDAIITITNLPAIDAVPVVRCKDCRFHSCEKGVPYCSNLDYGYGWDGDDFCSHGERREE